MSNAIPTVVIVGRPNVGKSTLFNRITGQRRSIVGDESGITRDRIHGTAEHDGRRFEVIDTGGIVVHDQEYIPGQILRQAEFVLKTADHIIFLVDGRAEITGSDRDLSQMLKRLGKPVSLAVNKIDSQVRDGLANEFFGLGIADVFPVSAEHGIGVDALLDRVTESFARGDRRWTIQRPRRPRRASRWRSSAGRTWANRRCSTRSSARSGPSFRPSPELRAIRWTRP